MHISFDVTAVFFTAFLKCGSAYRQARQLRLYQVPRSTERANNQTLLLYTKMYECS